MSIEFKLQALKENVEIVEVNAVKVPMMVRIACATGSRNMIGREARHSSEPKRIGFFPPRP